MALTYTLIASNTLTSTANTVTFSNIPNTYTDLLVKWSIRDSGTFTDRPIYYNLNSDTANIYSVTRIFIVGSGTVESGRSQNYNTPSITGGATASGATANTFSNGELYIANYLASANKQVFSFSVPETNATTFTGGMSFNGGLWRNTAAITSLSIHNESSGSFVTNSSFWLYGIKKD